MTRTLTEAEAQADFSQLITDACNGDEFLITRGNSPVVRLLPLAHLGAHEAQSSLKPDRRTWEEKMAAIKALRKAWVGPPPTIDEVLAARDEGRR